MTPCNLQISTTYISFFLFFLFFIANGETAKQMKEGLMRCKKWKHFKNQGDLKAGCLLKV